MLLTVDVSLIRVYVFFVYIWDSLVGDCQSECVCVNVT